MGRMLARCEGCQVHIFADESRCPFCNRSRRVIGAKKSLAAAAGAIAFMSGIGCAYGCPDGGCVDDFDAAATGDATTSDTGERPDVMVKDSSSGDSSFTDAMDASDGQTDALDAADADDG